MRTRSARRGGAPHPSGGRGPPWPGRCPDPRCPAPPPRPLHSQQPEEASSPLELLKDFAEGARVKFYRLLFRHPLRGPGVALSSAGLPSLGGFLGNQGTNLAGSRLRARLGALTCLSGFVRISSARPAACCLLCGCRLVSMSRVSWGAATLSRALK